MTLLPRLPVAGFLLSSLITGCGATPAPRDFPSAPGLPLLGHPVHLGNNMATGQNWAHGEATAAIHCSLVNLPREADSFVQVVGIRNTETLADQLQVNGQTFALPITLEQGTYGGITPSATRQSPLYKVRLPAGPSQVCLVAGERARGDVDDFEVDEVLLFAEGIPPEQIAINKGLTRGAPAPTLPNATTWGQHQQRPQHQQRTWSPARWGCAFMQRGQGC